MRTITDHQVNPANDKLTIKVMDEPGSGGANHLYQIEGFDTSTNPSDPWVPRGGTSSSAALLLFQNGPISEDGNGVNGITHEVLLAIVADRLRAFQAGPFANPFNAEALLHVNAAQERLLARTRERMSRGVEGTHKV